MTHQLKKIVIAAAIYPPAPGGPATHAKRYYEYFTKRGVKTVVCTYAQDGHRYTRDVVGISMARMFGLRQLIYLYRLFLISRGAQCVFAMDTLGAGIPALVVSRIRRVPLVLRVGGDIVWERTATEYSMMESYRRKEYSRVLFTISRIVLLRASRIVVPTSLLSNLYTTYYGVPSSLIDVIPNPLPVVPPPFDFSARVRGRTVVYASRFVAYKNVLRLIHSFVQVHKAVPDARLLLFGAGPQEGILSNAVRELRLEDVVAINTTSTPDERREAMQTATISVAPALTEFYPNYVMECLAYGVPPVVSREHGLPFTLRDEQQFDPMDEDDMARALVWALEQEPEVLLPDLSGALYWDEYVKKLEELLLSVIKIQ
ncbi:MAG: glycosyltransferase family 4 protein [bacterium]|nr:glycosyltransferase family 4 protein [bacterium]